MMKASAKNLLGNLSVGDGKAVAKKYGRIGRECKYLFLW